MFRRLRTLNRKSISIRSGTLAVLVCVNTVIILLLSLGAFAFFQQGFVNEIAGARSDVLRQIAERASQFKTNIYTLSNLYYNDGSFLSAVEELEQDNEEEFVHYMDDLTEEFQATFNQINLQFYVVFSSENGTNYCSLPTPQGYDYMSPKTKLWYNDIYEAKGAIMDVSSYRDDQLGIKAYTAARTVPDASGNIIGCLMINADERQLYKTYEEVIGPQSNIYVADSKGRIVSSNRDTLIGLSYFNMNNLETMFAGEDHIITKISGKDSLFTRYYDRQSGFTVFEEIPLSTVLEPLERIRIVVTILALLALAGGTVMAWFFSGYIAAPLRKLCGDIREVEGGQLDQEFEINSFSEINDLGTGMAQMLGRIRELIEDIQKNETEKRRLELRWLQAEINPHFMYNTLFSIKCAVDMGQNDEAGHMLTTFIQLLRGVLSGPVEMSTVRSQMEFIKKYVELQRFRYNGTFDALVECDERAANCLIPKLLIQPIVENAIVHGIDMTAQNGMIAVIARRQEDTVYIQVEDNGVGMTEDRIRQVMNTPENTDPPHIGVRNVHDRIRLHFGEEWGIHIESEPGMGTQIIMRFPARENASDPQNSRDTKKEKTC